MTTLAETLQPTVKAIYDWWKEKGDKSQYPAKSLGASQIGHPCNRYLWYYFRHCCRAEFEGRMYRLFERGNVEEPRIVKDLRKIGCQVLDIDPKTKEQIRVVDLGGHLSGKLDGAILGVPEAPKTWHVLEIKTHNTKSFAKLKKEGVEKAQPKHYAQCQIYMHKTGMKRTLYVAVNKDTEEIYTERIRHNKEEAEMLVERARLIITLQEPPERISSARPDHYICRFCDARDICFGSLPPNPNLRTLNVPYLSCRQCCHATPVLDGVDGRWKCEKKQITISIGCPCECPNHLCLPGLFATQEVVGHGKDTVGNHYIKFKDERYGEWTHGAGGFGSAELRELPLPLLNNGMINKTKEILGAKVEARPDDILDRYLPEECDLVWSGRVDDLDDSVWVRIYCADKGIPDPIATCKFDTHYVAEYEGERIIVILPSGRAQIWEKQ